VISYRRLRQTEYYWDDIHLRVQRENSSETVFYMKEIHEQYMIKYNSYIVAAFPVSSELSGLHERQMPIDGILE
jgi:hypothetical protein